MCRIKTCDERDTSGNWAFDLHVLLSDNTERREDFDNLCHHVGLFGVDRSRQQQQAPLISQDPLQAVLSDGEEKGRKGGRRRKVRWVLVNESILIHGKLSLQVKNKLHCVCKL